MSAYSIASAEARIAKTPSEAAAIAQTMGFPVALRLASRQHTRDRPTVASTLLLETPVAVKAAAERMVERCGAAGRRAIQGFSLERMARRPGTHEVMIRVGDDPIFGPVIIFGHGGLATDIIGDRAVALPPLNTSLARELLSRTRIYRLLHGYGDCPPADIDALCLTLVQVSQMIIDLPQIAALEINPLFVDDQGVFAVDAQILIARPTEDSERRLAIRPYPKELEEEFVLAERAHGTAPADPPGGRTGAPRLHRQVLAGGPAAALFPPRSAGCRTPKWRV